jgi:cytochrome c oxidase subunit IV
MGRIGGLTAAWLSLLVLLAAELLVTLLPIRQGGATVVLIFAAVMLAIIGLAFMRLRSASGLAQAFVVAGVFWVMVLLGLGSMDPLTRTDYPVPVTTYP